MFTIQCFDSISLDKEKKPSQGIEPSIVFFTILCFSIQPVYMQRTITKNSYHSFSIQCFDANISNPEKTHQKVEPSFSSSAHSSYSDNIIYHYNCLHDAKLLERLLNF